ncbi:MAG: C10 family peptidase [Thermoplasmatota archaeon]
MKTKRLIIFSLILILLLSISSTGFVTSIQTNALSDSFLSNASSEMILTLEIQDEFFKQTTSYGGFLTTQWSQNVPYNNFCPMDLSTGTRSIAGCPAVAMAQIINYHHTTKNIQFNDSDDYYHNFGTNKYWIDNDHLTYDFPSYPQLNTYLNDLMIHYENQIPPTTNDIAALVFSCGVASKQVYSSSVSGTYGVMQTYTAYKRFNFTDVELLTENDPDLFDRMNQNIQNGLPVHIAVVNEQWTVGHHMVVDGIDQDGRYHVNFGWGGPHDGWYYIPSELPYDLTVIEGIIVDIYDDTADSDLKGNGFLHWTDVKPGTIVYGSFSIENSGLPHSTIDWEIESYPEWGEWTFSPHQGQQLSPEDGPVTIEVSVKAPDVKQEKYGGYVKIVDINNENNSCSILVSLATVKTTLLMYHLVFDLLKNHPYIFQFLEILLDTNLFPLPNFIE